VTDRTVGIIGLGIMGGAIARNLVERGWEVVGFDTDPARRSELALAGVTIADGAVAVASRTKMIMTSLPNSDAANAVATQIAGCGQPPRIVIELSTFTIADKLRFKAILEPAGHIALDCPLSGTGAQAVVRDLVVYASGDSAAIARCGRLFADFAKQSADLGAYGNGSRMKFVANLLVAVHNAAAAEAIVLGVKAGLDPERIVEVISSGAGTSRIFELRGPMMASGIYTPPTATMHVLQKDSATIAEFARLLGVDTPLLDAAAPLYDEAEALGYGEEDVAAVHAVLARRAGVETKK